MIITKTILFIILSIFNIILCIILSTIYLHNYHTIRLSYSLGLVLFSILLLFSSILNLYNGIFLITHNMEPSLIKSVENMIKFIALTILTVITLYT